MIIQNKIYYLLGVAIYITIFSLPSHAWRGGTGVARGPRGGSAAWHNGAGVAYGPRGGSAAWNRGAGVAYGPNGGAAAWNNRGAYHGAYRAPVPAYGYRPPVYYGGNYGYSSGQVAAAGVAGLAVGAMAGAAVANANQPSNTTVIVQQPASSWAIGTNFNTLPSGCSSVVINSTQYFQCGSSWMRPYSGYYQVVPAPY